MLKKYFFLLSFVTIAMANSFGADSLLSLSINVLPSDSEQGSEIHDNTTPMTHELTIDPSEKERFSSMTLHVGEELIVDVLNADNLFFNGTLSNAASPIVSSIQSDRGIYNFMSVDNYVTWENWYHNRRPLNLIDLGYQSPLYFHYQAVHEGSVTLKFSKSFEAPF